MYATRCMMLMVIGATLLGGCTYFQEQKAHRVERLLSASGFRMKLADTPEKLTRVQAMRQRIMQPLKRRGTLYYAYPDAAGCRCVYLGDAKAYQQYQQLAFDEHMAHEERTAAETDEDAAIINDDAVWDQWGMDVW